MPSSLFRKNALNGISAPEQLDKHIRIMNPATWILYTALLVSFVFLIIWSLAYNISNSINAKGVIFTNSSVFNIYSSSDTIVNNVLVEKGEHVEVGDIIAVVANEQMLSELEELKYQQLSMDVGSQEYEDMNSRIDSLAEQYIASTIIKSNCRGYIQSVKSVGNALATGDTIASIMSDDGYNELIAFVPLDVAKTLSLGLEAQISPSYAAREEYGYMTGIITSIDTVPTTEESIIKHMGTMLYVQDILPEEACVEVRIKLDLDSDSANEYNWSNPKGQSLNIELGTQCDVKIISDEFRPIEFILN